MPPFDPDEYLARRAQEKEAFDPDKYLASREAAKEVSKPRGPDLPISDDPITSMFVSPEALAVSERPFTERAAESATFYGPMAPIAADTATFGVGNRALAYTRSLIGRALGEETDYAQKLAEQNTTLERWRQEEPERSIAAELTGGVAGPMGIARTGFTLARPGAGWISRAARGGAEGAAYGAAQGAGHEYGNVGDKILAGGTGAAFGAAVGAGVPLAVSGAAGGRALWNAARGRPPEYPTALARAVEADRPGVENMFDLGPEAMLPDTGPSVRVLAQGAATGTGPGRSALVNALRLREEQTIPRMTAERQRILGPAPVPGQVAEQLDEARAALGPGYERAFARARAVDPEPVAHWIEAQIVNTRGPTQAALRDVRNALNITGTDVLDPHPRVMHQVRQMIDAMQDSPDMPRQTRAALTSVRNRLSEELHTNVPGMANLDAQFAEIARRGQAFQRGQEIFDTGRAQAVRPAEWQQEVAELAVPSGGPRSTVAGPSAAPLYSRLGTSAEIDRMVGTGVDDLRTLERRFGPGNWAMQNLATQFGVRNAEEFARMLRINRTFRESYNKIVHNSKTAETLGAAQEAGGEIQLPRMSLPGVVDMLNVGLSRAQAGLGTATRDRIAEIMASRGPELQRVRRDLLDLAGEQRRRDVVRQIIENAIRSGSTGLVPALQ